MGGLCREVGRGLSLICGGLRFSSAVLDLGQEILRLLAHVVDCAMELVGFSPKADDVVMIGSRVALVVLRCRQSVPRVALASLGRLEKVPAFFFMVLDGVERRLSGARVLANGVHCLRGTGVLVLDVAEKMPGFFGVM